MCSLGAVCVQCNINCTKYCAVYVQLVCSVCAVYVQFVGRVCAAYGQCMGSLCAVRVLFVMKRPCATMTIQTCSVGEYARTTLKMHMVCDNHVQCESGLMK